MAGGKLPGRSSVTGDGAINNINLCFANDTLHRRTFLVDTGAELSVIPASKSDKLAHPPTTPLTAANGSFIATFGKRKVQFKLGNELYEWQFVIAEVERPLLGADFLRHAGLLVNVRTGKLINPDTMQSYQLTSYMCRSVLSASKSSKDSYQAVLDEFPSLTTPAFDLPEVKHGVFHHISTEGPPVHSRVRRLAPDRLKAARTEFHEFMLNPKNQLPWYTQVHGFPLRDHLTAEATMIFLLLKGQNHPFRI